MNRLLLVFLIFYFYGSLQAEEGISKIHYDLKDDPIDVVFVSHPKDKETLDYCIDGIRENCKQVRRVIVVSSKKLTHKAEWFDEKKFPFGIDDVALAIGRGDKKKSEKFFKHHSRPPGWYFQQLLKLYSPFVIPNISSNVLVIDADTVFMNRVEFLNEAHGGLFCVSHMEPKKRYLKHAQRLVPGYQRVHPEVYSVCHHMLFQRAILKDLFQTVEKYHHKKFWFAFCLAVNLEEKKGASEYEIYFSFALNHTDQVALRELNWMNSAALSQREQFKKRGFSFCLLPYLYARAPFPLIFFKYLIINIL